MSGTGYKILGYIVWQAGKRYARRRLPSARTKAAGAATTFVAVGAMVLIARRVANGRSDGAA